MHRFLPWKIIAYQLYLFQLEEYEEDRFLRSLFKKGLVPPKSLRKDLIMTTKIKVNLILGLLLKVTFAFALSYISLSFFNSDSVFLLLALFIFFTYLTDFFHFAFAIQAAWITSPFENYAKNKLIKDAIKKLNGFTQLKVIGITGSYGKTTMKEVLRTVLAEKFDIAYTKGNYNTPIGLARAILNDVNINTQILLIEMGEYKKGDVAEICSIATPNIAIITGINEAHLERYGSMENAISTKFEIAQNAKLNSTILLNGDDKLITDNYKKFIPDSADVKFFTSTVNELAQVQSSNTQFDQERPGVNFDLKIGKEFIEDIKTQFVSNYIIGYASAAAIVAKDLGMKLSEIKFALSKVKPFEHRLEPKWSGNNILIIDDTYNGNSTGIKEGISILQKFEGKRKVYVTPGLVETGDEAKKIHLEIGKWLSKVADLVVLTRNSVTPFIEEGLLESGFKRESIVWFNTSKETYENLYKHLKPNDVVLMQNDWSDNYY